MLFSVNLFCLELLPDLLGKVFSSLFWMHEIRVDFWRDPQIVVHNSCLKFQLQSFRGGIISHGAQNPGFDRQSFQRITTLLHVRRMVKGFYGNDSWEKNVRWLTKQNYLHDQNFINLFFSQWMKAGWMIFFGNGKFSSLNTLTRPG